MKFDICLFFENLPRRFKFLRNLTRIADALHDDVCIFTTVFRLSLLRMRNVLDRRCRENQSTHYLLNVFFPESRTVYRIMWENMVEPDRPQMTI